MSNYFSNFPVITYDNKNVRDITRRNSFIKRLQSNPYVFLPYSIKEGEKPEDIAYNYYGSVEATWLILLANNIIDPYHQWPLSEEQLNNFIMKKYKNISNEVGYKIIDWTKNETIDTNVLYYYKEVSPGVYSKVYPSTFRESFLKTENDDFILTSGFEKIFTSINVPDGWSAYRIFDYERDLNENKREISIVEQKYYNSIKEEFKTLIRK